MTCRFQPIASLLLAVLLALLAPPVSAQETQPALGVLLLNEEWTWTARHQERMKLPQRPGLVSDWHALFDPVAGRRLSDAQKQRLLSDPRRLLASRSSAAILRPRRLLLVGPETDGRVPALQVDLATGARETLQSPTGLDEEEAWEALVQQGLEGEGPAPVPVVANPESRMYHRPGAAHLSPRSPAEPRDDRAVAEKEGFRPCPVCFPDTNRLVQQDEFERELGRAAAGMVEDQYRVSQDPEERRRVTAVGERLMEANRFQDRGYRFVVLESDELNAFSVPTGPIYITVGLLRALETPDELAAVLAHELAHSERHHLRQQYERSQWVGILGSVLGSATGSYWARQAGGFLADLMSKGFSRDFELEADREAVLMSYAAGYRPEDFALTLTKLGEVSEQLGQGGGPDWFDTHPAAEGRVQQVREMLTRLAPLEEKLVVLEGQGDGELAGHLRRRARDFLEDPKEIRDFLAAYGALDLDPGRAIPIEEAPGP